MTLLEGLNIVSILILFILTSSFVVVFLAIYLAIFKINDRNAIYYILCKIIQTVSVGVLITPGYVQNSTLMMLHNLLFITGIAGEAYIFISISKIHKKLNGIILLLLASSSVVYNLTNLFLSGSTSARLLVVGLFSFLVYAFMGGVLLFNKKNTKMQRVTGWFSIIFAIPWLIRTYYVLANYSNARLFDTNTLQMIAYIGTIVFFSVLPMLYLLIFKEKDRMLLQDQYQHIVDQNKKISSKNNQLKELNATKDNFFRIIGHDLRSPILNTIQLFQFIENNYNDLSEKEILRYINSIKESSIQGFKLLENLLDWARCQTGRIKFSPELQRIDELILENVELLKTQSDSKQISINTYRLYEEPFVFDCNMINTVLRNLVSNAIKFTQENGEIEISCILENDYLVVEVKDNGVGMSDENYSKLFNLDAGFSSLGTHNEKGTGIGLVLCKEFIDRHQGEIWASSKLGSGSSFFFKLPIELMS